MKWFTIIAFAAALSVCAADKPKAETFLDPEKAGQDYKDQSEYKNDWGGCQIIALGNDEFRMVTYPGGLPGEGANVAGKRENSGKRQGTKVVFTGENDYRAELANGTITIHTASGGPYSMEKVERKSPTLGAKPP